MTQSHRSIALILACAAMLALWVPTLAPASPGGITISAIA